MTPAAAGRTAAATARRHAPGNPAAAQCAAAIDAGRAPAAAAEDAEDADSAAAGLSVHWGWVLMHSDIFLLLRRRRQAAGIKQSAQLLHNVGRLSPVALFQSLAHPASHAVLLQPVPAASAGWL